MMTPEERRAHLREIIDYQSKLARASEAERRAFHAATTALQAAVAAIGDAVAAIENVTEHQHRAVQAMLQANEAALAMWHEEQ